MGDGSAGCYDRGAGLLKVGQFEQINANRDGGNGGMGVGLGSNVMGAWKVVDILEKFSEG